MRCSICHGSGMVRACGHFYWITEPCTACHMGYVSCCEGHEGQPEQEHIGEAIYVFDKEAPPRSDG